MNNDMWSGEAGPQSIHACSYSSWFTISNQPQVANNLGSVKTYPDVQWQFGDQKTIGQFSSMTSTFCESFPRMGDWDAAYDIWTNNWKNETMIWNDANGQEIPPPGANGAKAAAIDGAGWHEWDYGKNSSGTYDYVAVIMDAKKASGSVNVLDVFKWLIANGYMKSTDTLTAVDYGVEISVTQTAPGVAGPEKFTLNDFSLAWK